MGSWDPYVAPDRYACACHQHWIMVYDAPCSVRLKTYVRSSMNVHSWNFVSQSTVLQEHQQKSGAAPYWLWHIVFHSLSTFVLVSELLWHTRAMGFGADLDFARLEFSMYFAFAKGPCPGPVPSMSRSCLTHVTVMVQSGCSRFLLLQWWFPVTMLSCLIMIRNPAVMPWSRAGHVLVVCRHAHDSYVAVLSCSCHVILNIYSSPPGNFLCRMVCTQCAHSVPGLHGPNLHPENDRVSDRINESMFQ